MDLSEELKARLGVAINEADLIGVELDEHGCTAVVTLAVLSLPQVGPAQGGRHVRFVFHPVGRVAASWREGDWDDAAAEATEFEPGKLLEVVQGFGAQPVYGWDFFDVHERQFPAWSDRLSLDWRGGSVGMRHSISLFQEGVGEHLDLCIWFDAFEIQSAPSSSSPAGQAGQPIDIDEFCDGGSRWWQAMRAGDPLAGDRGISPMSEND